MIWFIRNGAVIDGSGAPARQADVAILGDMIAEVGQVEGAGRREIDASGLIVTPGFVDVHTHYDGQAIWSDRLIPSSDHGVTTVVIGNCGVGFAPCRPEDRDELVELMEAWKISRGIVLAEGLTWDWETFPPISDALDRRPHDIDIAVLLPHSPLRVVRHGRACAPTRTG